MQLSNVDFSVPLNKGESRGAMSQDSLRLSLLTNEIIPLIFFHAFKYFSFADALNISKTSKFFEKTLFLKACQIYHISTESFLKRLSLYMRKSQLEREILSKFQYPNNEIFNSFVKISNATAIHLANIELIAKDKLSLQKEVNMENVYTHKMMKILDHTLFQKISPFLQSNSKIACVVFNSPLHSSHQRNAFIHTLVYNIFLDVQETAKRCVNVEDALDFQRYKQPLLVLLSQAKPANNKSYVTLSKYYEAAGSYFYNNDKFNAAQLFFDFVDKNMAGQIELLKKFDRLLKSKNEACMRLSLVDIYAKCNQVGFKKCLNKYLNYLAYGEDVVEALSNFKKLLIGLKVIKHVSEDVVKIDLAKEAIEIFFTAALNSGNFILIKEFVKSRLCSSDLEFNRWIDDFNNSLIVAMQNDKELKVEYSRAECDDLIQPEHLQVEYDLIPQECLKIGNAASVPKNQIFDFLYGNASPFSNTFTFKEKVEEVVANDDLKEIEKVVAFAPALENDKKFYLEFLETSYHTLRSQGRYREAFKIIFSIPDEKLKYSFITIFLDSYGYAAEMRDSFFEVLRTILDPAEQHSIACSFLGFDD